MEINQSLYEILGVDQNADLDTIKRAYRKLVQLYHPDKAGNSPENTERFAKICKAYEILSDPDKRALYDKPRRSRTFYRSSWRPPKGANFSSQQPAAHQQFTQGTHKRNPSWKQPHNSLNLDDLFGGAAESPKPQPNQFGGRYAQNQASAGARSDGEDIHVEVDVPRSTASRGGMVQFEYRRLRRTDGLEVQSVLELFYLRVPAGTRHGEVLDIEKMGHTGLNGGRSGDLHCTVNIVSDEANSDARNQNMTHATQKTSPAHTGASQSSSRNQHSEGNENIVQITFPEAVLGGRVSLSTPQGEVTISIPAGTSSGRKLRIRGKGIDGADYIVTLHIVVPTDLDPRSLELVQEFAERNPMSPRQ